MSRQNLPRATSFYGAIHLDPDGTWTLEKIRIATRHSMMIVVIVDADAYASRTMDEIIDAMILG
jgi:hypothetical protein